MGVHALRRAAVFLDRDGVLNAMRLGPDGVPRPPATAADLVVLPRVPQAIVRLRALGFDLIVVTNQPDIARGTQTREQAVAINERLRTELGLDDVRMCAHDDADACGCRKPAPGLLVLAAAERGVDLTRSYMVGDRWRDVEAGRRAGCRTVLLDSGYAEGVPSSPDHRAADLWEAVRWIEQREG